MEGITNRDQARILFMTFLTMKSQVELADGGDQFRSLHARMLESVIRVAAGDPELCAAVYNVAIGQLLFCPNLRAYADPCTVLQVIAAVGMTWQIENEIDEETQARHNALAEDTAEWLERAAEAIVEHNGALPPGVIRGWFTDTFNEELGEYADTRDGVPDMVREANAENLFSEMFANLDPEDYN